MPVNEDDPRLVFVPLSKAATPPPGLIEHLKDRYWCSHPENGLLFWSIPGSRLLAPQCNANEGIARHLRDSLYPWAEVKLVPSVFREIDPRDYC